MHSNDAENTDRLKNNLRVKLSSSDINDGRRFIPSKNNSSNSYPKIQLSLVNKWKRDVLEAAYDKKDLKAQALGFRNCPDTNVSLNEQLTKSQDKLRKFSISVFIFFLYSGFTKVFFNSFG